MYNCIYFLNKYISLNTYVAAGFLLLGVFSVIFFYYIRKKSGSSDPRMRKLLDIGYTFVLVGGIANLAERLLTKCVSDSLTFFGLVFYNLSDIAVTFGILVIVIGLHYVPKAKNLKE